ncbi:hypothetical protein GGS24DRAFT_416561 [Hypoxylon argillaceum]|nr:hypothetical protein GGS24DRAFT_416561 [Hypoxylon argillaceum]
MCNGMGYEGSPMGDLRDGILKQRPFPKTEDVNGRTPEKSRIQWLLATYLLMLLVTGTLDDVVGSRYWCMQPVGGVVVVVVVVVGGNYTGAGMYGEKDKYSRAAKTDPKGKMNGPFLLPMRAWHMNRLNYCC